jgi:hypothetical protein
MSTPPYIRPDSTTASFEDLSDLAREGRHGRKLLATGTLPKVAEFPEPKNPNDPNDPSFFVRVSESVADSSQTLDINELPNLKSYTFKIPLPQWQKNSKKIAKLRGIVKINLNFINSSSDFLSFTLLTDSNFSPEDFSRKFQADLTENLEQSLYRVQVGELELVFPLKQTNDDLLEQPLIPNTNAQASQQLTKEPQKPTYFGSYLQIKLPILSSPQELELLLQAIGLTELIKNKKLAVFQDSEFNLIITNNAERGVIDLLILAQEILNKCPLAGLFINENTGSNINQTKLESSSIYIPKRLQESILANRRLNYLVDFITKIAEGPKSEDTDTSPVEICNIKYKSRSRKAIDMSGTEFQDLISRYKNTVELNQKIVNFVGKAGTGKTETILNILQGLEDSGRLVEFNGQFVVSKQVVIFTNFRDKNSSSLGAGIADIFEQAQVMLSDRFQAINRKYNLSEDQKQFIQSFLDLDEQQIYQLAKQEPAKLLKLLANVINLFIKVDILGVYYLVIEDLHFADITSAQLITKFIKEIHSPNLRVITSSRYNHEFENLQVAFALEEIKDDKKAVENAEIPTLNLVKFNPTTQEIIPNRVQMHKFLTNFIKAELQSLLKLNYHEFDYYSFSILLGLANGNPETMQRLLRLVAEQNGFKIGTNSELTIQESVLEKITSLRTATNSEKSLNATIDINRIQNNQVFKPEHRVTAFIIGILGEKDQSLIIQIASTILQQPEANVHDLLETLLDAGYIKLDQRNEFNKIQLNSLDLKLHLQQLIPTELLLQICQSILINFRHLLDQETVVFIQTIIIQNTPQELYLHSELEAIPDIYELLKNENHSIYSIKHAQSRLAILQNLKSLDQRTSLYSSEITPSPDLKLDYLVQQKILAELSIAALSRQSEKLIQISQKYEPLLDTPYLKDIKSDFYSLMVFGLAIIRQTDSESKNKAFSEMLKYLTRLKAENQTELYNLGLVHTLLQLEGAKIPDALLQLDQNLNSSVSHDPNCPSIKAGYFIGLKFLKENENTESPLKLELERLINRISFERDRKSIEGNSGLDTRELYTYYEVPEDFIERSQARIKILQKYIQQYQDSPNSLLEQGILPVLDQLRSELVINLPTGDQVESKTRARQIIQFSNNNIEPFSLNAGDLDSYARNRRTIASLTLLNFESITLLNIIELIDTIQSAIKLYPPQSNNSQKELLLLDKICYFALFASNLDLKSLTEYELRDILDILIGILNDIVTILECYNYEQGTQLSDSDIFDWGSIGSCIVFCLNLLSVNPHNGLTALYTDKARIISTKQEYILEKLEQYLDTTKIRNALNELNRQYQKSPLGITSANQKGLEFLLQQIELTTNQQYPV